MSLNNPIHLFTSLWEHRNLIVQLTKREILSKYRGAFGGIVWLFLSPLLMLGLYTFTFGFVMQVKWPDIDNMWMYALLVYVGMILLNFFSECLQRAPSLIVSNPNFVKKVVFPLEIYPWVSIGTALFHTSANICMLALFTVCILGKLPLTIFFLPLLLMPLLLITVGMSWFLSAVGVYVRDIAHLMTFVLQIIMYLSPVFYSITKLPPLIQTLLLLNPLTYIIEQARNVIIFGTPPHLALLSIYYVCALIIAWLGFVWFQKTKDGFADVL